MEKSPLEHEPTTAPPEPDDDPNKTLQKTLEIIEALGRDLDEIESQPRHGFLRFIRERLFRGTKN